MKHKIKIFCAASILLLGACKKSYLDINTNPNNPTTVTPGLVLTNALNSTATNTTGSINFYQFAAPWIGYWSESGAVSAFSEERSYQFTSNYGPAANIWSGLYNNLEDYNYVEQQGAILKNPFYGAVAKTMKAYDFENLVDIYGNIPYSDALKSTAAIRPKYDKGQDIYEDLARKLDTAATTFKSLVGKIAKIDAGYDIMYAGDAAKWGRFANTLKLRILLRQSQMPGRAAYITTEMAKITANGMGFIDANMDDKGNGEAAFVNPGYTNSSGKQNPYYATFGYTPAAAPTDNHRYYIASTYGLAFYQNNNDPRLPFLYTTINDGAGATYSGTPFGPTATSDDNPQFKSAIGTGLLKGADMAQPLMTDFESLFLQAEASYRGFITTGTQGLYESAVQQNFTYLGAGSASDYLKSNVANWNNNNTNPDKLKLIITQKWAAMNGINAIESWSDYRRLGIPADVPISNNPAASTRQIPVRMLYPQSEYNYNPDNVLAQGAISQFTSRIFWNIK